MKIFVINGPNLNMLGIREPQIYGTMTFSELCDYIEKSAHDLGVKVEIFQSNCEGALVDIIQSAYKKADGIIINPAAYTHTSIAILDALKSVSLPTVEVHLSDISKRESFRAFSYTSLACEKRIMGLGKEGYREAIIYLINKEKSDHLA